MYYAGDYHRALNLFETSNDKRGAHHVTYHNIGICHYFENKLQQAIMSFDASLSL